MDNMEYKIKLNKSKTNKNDEKGRLIQIHKIYIKRITRIFDRLIKKYCFYKETGLKILANQLYEYRNAKKFEDEWIEEIDKLWMNTENEFDVHIEHNGETVIIITDKFSYDGILMREL